MLQTKRYEGLCYLPQSYADIFENAGRKSFFLSRPWFWNFEKTILRQDEQTLIYGVESCDQGNRPLAALLLKRRRTKHSVFSSNNIESLSNYYTSYFETVIAHDYDNMAEIMSCLASAFWQDRKSWDVLNISPFDPESPTCVSLVKSLKDLGIITQNYFCFGNWYLELSGRSYNEYLRDLPSVLRKNIPYMMRKNQKSHRIRLEIYTDEEKLERAFLDYENVYNASWKNHEPYPNFIRGLVYEACAQGWLRLGLLYVDDEPAAAQLWIVHGRIASIYKISYDQRFSNLSVGTILTAHLMQHVIDVDKVTEVDYLSGDDAYKKDWMSHRRERWGIIAFNPSSVKGLLQAVRHVGGARMKSFLTPAHTPG